MVTYVQVLSTGFPPPPDSVIENVSRKAGPQAQNSHLAAA